MIDELIRTDARTEAFTKHQGQIEIDVKAANEALDAAKASGDVAKVAEAHRAVTTAEGNHECVKDAATELKNAQAALEAAILSGVAAEVAKSQSALVEAKKEQERLVQDSSSNGEVDFLGRGHEKVRHV